MWKNKHLVPEEEKGKKTERVEREFCVKVSKLKQRHYSEVVKALKESQYYDNFTFKKWRNIHMKEVNARLKL